MTDSPTADIPRDSRTAKDVIDTIAEGQFYEDYDQSTGDLGILRALLSERDELRAQLQAARDDNEAMRKAVDGTLSERMVAAGMVPLDAMTQPNCLTKFSVHSGMTDLKFFEEWVERKAKEYGKMQAAHQAGEYPLDPEVFDFVLGKSGAFKEVLENYRAALKSTSAEGEG